MIPQTLGALLAFLGLIAPGLVYRLVLERRRPSHADSTFVEASRVALTSLVLDTWALGILWLFEANTQLPLPNAAEWLAQGTKYAAANLGKVVFGVASQVIIACLLAAAGGWLATRRSPSRFRNETTYGAVFRRYAPAGSTAWVHVCLDNGVEFWGFERAHDDRDQARVRTLTLAGDTIMRKLPDEPERTRVGADWDVVVLDADHIRYMRVIYIDPVDNRFRAVRGSGHSIARSTRPWSWFRIGRQRSAAAQSLGPTDAPTKVADGQEVTAQG